MRHLIKIRRRPIHQSKVGRCIRIDSNFSFAAVNADLKVTDIRFTGSTDASPVKPSLRPLNRHEACHKIYSKGAFFS